MAAFDFRKKPDALLDRLKKTTDFRGGAVGFSDHSFEDVCSTLPSLMELPPDFDHGRARNLLKAAFMKLDNEFSADDISEACRQVYNDRATRPSQPYRVFSKFTIVDELPFSDFEIDGCTFALSSAIGAEVDQLKATAKRRQSSAPTLVGSDPDHQYLGVRAEMHEKDSLIAVRRYESASQKIRGIINLAINYQTASWTLFGTEQEAKNKVRNDEVVIPVCKSSASTPELWQITPWAPPRVPCSLAGENRKPRRELLAKYAEKLQERSALSRFAGLCAQRYCRSLDDTDPQYALVQLWATLERMLCLETGDKYDVLIRRAKNLFFRDPLVPIYLDHLKDRRNQLVHDGFYMESALARQLVDQLTRICSSVLHFIILNPLDLKSVEQFRDYISLSSDADSLRQKRELIERRLRIVESDK